MDGSGLPADPRTLFLAATVVFAIATMTRSTPAGAVGTRSAAAASERAGRRPTDPSSARGRTLTAALNASTADEPLDGSDVEAAVDYWDDRGGVDGTTLEYVGTGPAPNADVVVEGKPYIRWCGTSGRGRVVGCTGRIVSGDRLVEATVEVATTENESAVDLTLKHELGGVLGLEHGELPEEVG